MQKVNDPPLRKCPHCGKAQLTRLMSAPVFRLKGGGWYETDFKGDQDHKKNLADRPEAEAAKEDKAPAADVKASETGKEAGKESVKTEKTADKPAEKAPAAESPKPPAGAGMSRRGAGPVKPAAKPAAKPAPKSRAKKPLKKPAAKARARR
jgi:predicted nucleic acid-binding Zn ribbon protein